MAISAYIEPEGCPYWSFFVAAGNSATFSGEDLRGKGVSVSNGIAQYYLARFLEQYGLTLNDVTLENIPAEARGEAVTNGSIALAWSTEPRLTRIRQEYGVEDVAQAQELMPNSEVSLLIFGPTVLEREDDLAVRFLTAYLLGSRLANDGANEHNIEIMSEQIGFEPELLAEACWPRFREDGSLNVEAATEYINWMNEQGLIDSIIDIDALYDPSYAEQALERIADMLEATPEAP